MTIPDPVPAGEQMGDCERALLAAAASGTLLDLRAGDPGVDDPAKGANWGTGRQVRAELLSELLTGARCPDGKAPHAIKLRGARITGRLDLQARTLTCALWLQDCCTDEPVDINEATATSICLNGCFVPALTARQLRTTRDLELAHGFTAHGEVNLASAHIGGHLDLTGACLVNPNGTALAADGLTVDKDMSCGTGFSARGKIGLGSARIGGILSFIGAHLENGNRPALASTQLDVVQSMVFSNISVRGEVLLQDAHIGGKLLLRQAQLENPSGQALAAPGLTVDQDMICKDGFTARGGVRLTGAHIGGQLVLAGAKLANENGRALNAEGLIVDQDMICQGGFEASGEICLTGAHIGGWLGFTGATLENDKGSALVAEALTVGQSMYCNDGFTAHGQVCLFGAHIGDRLLFNQAELTNENGIALFADEVTIGKSMSCNGFTARGEVRLTGAQIGGQLTFNGATLTNLTNGNRYALDAENLTVGKGMYCLSRVTATGKASFTATGGVRLRGAHIGGQLGFRGANLANENRPALHADWLTVDHDMFCNDGFTAHGEVRLHSAHIRGQLQLQKASLVNENSRALFAKEITVDHDMFCNEGFEACGEVNLIGAHIGGQLDFSGASLANHAGTALDLDSASAATLTLQPGQRPDGIVKLANAKVGHFADDPASWPQAVNLRGFVYDALDNDQVSVGQRLKWLARNQCGYDPQVYDQLATAYKNAGHDDAARHVAIAKQWRRRNTLNPLNWLWYATVGYGYRTWLAGIWLAALVGLGTWVFSGAYPAHMIALSAHPPAFHAAAYALDLLLPVIGLGQKSAWQPQGSAYQYWSWVLTGAGWVLTTAVVAGLTGIIKRN